MDGALPELAEGLPLELIGVRLPEEEAVFRRMQELVWCLSQEMFSNRVITPGKTTTSDLAWWWRLRVNDLGLGTWSVNIQLNNGAKPQGTDLSPDGNELAVALNGASSLAFVDTNTRTVSATLIPNVDGSNAPFDVKYGRTGRLYSSGTSDYIHVINTVSHSEVSRSPRTIGGTPYLAISSTKAALFAN